MSAFIAWAAVSAIWILWCGVSVWIDVREARQKEDLRRRNIAARMRERLEAGKAERLKL